MIGTDAQRAAMRFDFPPVDRLEDYEAPFASGAVKADLAGNLWVLPRTSAAATGGLLYDVINRQGAIVYRVQFPKQYSLVGFGDGGAMYVLRSEGIAGFLSQVKLP